ncbi:hypothetical protein BHM03_00058156 [Ensete ventricosum]|nr:hypothetical protein BHM03_00058156 [Ensete ventricosum]
MVVEGCNSGTTGLMAVKGCGSGMIGLMVAEGCNSGTTGLMVAEGYNSGTTRLMVVEGCNSGTNELMVVEGCNSGTIGLMVAEGCDSSTTGLMVAEGCNSSTTGLMAAKGMHQEYMLVDRACLARGDLGLRRLHVCRFTLQIVTCRTGNFGNSAMDLNVLRKKPGMSSGKSAPVAGAESSHLEVEVIHVETLAKRPVGSSVPDQAAASQLGKRVKVAVRKDDEGYYILQMADWALRDLSVGMQARWPNLSYLMKIVRDPEKLVAARQQADELQANNAKQRSGLDELTSQLEQVDKELNELWAGLAENQMKEQKADRCKVNDELLKAELLGKSIADYKQLVGFEWGLRWMGQVSYEHGYRVTLAHFQARYPNLEVDNDPFTEQSEDSSIPMETRQEFDESVPLEE